MLSKTPIFLVIAFFAVGAAVFLMVSKTSPQEAKIASCDAVLSQETIALPLECTEELGGDAGVATLTIEADGTLSVTEDDRLIFANPIFDDEGSTEYVGFDGTLSSDGIRFEDVTFDGYKDIALLYSAGAYNWTYQYYAYDPHTESYESRPLLEAVNPEVDLETKTISSYAKGRGLGDIYTAETYEFRDGMYVLVRSVVQDFASDDAFGSYVRVTEELQDGKMVETARENLSYKDVWGEEPPPME